MVIYVQSFHYYKPSRSCLWASQIMVVETIPQSLIYSYLDLPFSAQSGLESEWIPGHQWSLWWFHGDFFIFFPGLLPYLAMSRWQIATQGPSWWSPHCSQNRSSWRKSPATAGRRSRNNCRSHRTRHGFHGTLLELSGWCWRQTEFLLVGKNYQDHEHYSIVESLKKLCRMMSNACGAYRFWFSHGSNHQKRGESAVLFVLHEANRSRGSWCQLLQFLDIHIYIYRYRKLYII